MTTTTAAAAPQPPTKKRTAKKAAKKTAPPGYLNTDDIKAELVGLATSVGDTIPISPGVYARILFLSFSMDAGNIRRPDVLLPATQRIGHWFRTSKLTRKERESMIWTERVFSELQNCRCFIREKTDDAILLLKTVMAAKGNLNAVLFDDVNTVVYDTVNYIKAYNMVVDIMADITLTPEMTLGNIFTNVEHIVDMGKACNKAIGADKIELDGLTAAPKPIIKSCLRRNIETSRAGTLLSWLITTYIDIIAAEPKK